MSRRLNEFLAREAGEYLDRIQRLLGGADPADPAELLRLARGVRGSAQMAGAEAVARAAERLEEAARAAVAPGGALPGELRARLSAEASRIGELVRAAAESGSPGEPGGPAAEAEDPAIPIERLFHDDAGPHVLSGPGAAEPVPIESLLLQGEDALRMALSLEPKLASALREGRSGEVAPLLDEVFDLIRLGLSPG